MSSWIPLALVRKIEYALVEPQLNRQDVEAGCAAAARYDCYSVVVKPHYVEFARKLLKESRLKTASVVGFPLGGATTATKMFETQDIIQRGAEEISMVINIGALRDREDLLVHNDIATVVRMARGRPVTVILEVSLLTDEEKTRACQIAESSGASFIQTSTLFAPVAVTVEEIHLLRAASPRAQIKAAGGIDSLDTALEMLEAGAARIVASHFG
ncbi:MAG: deoxyribose-phosphate aldolase [Chloroflexi bacterium]|nr:deoxyribose-phosphate aldolase [Chloroflexota bacterium]